MKKKTKLRIIKRKSASPEFVGEYPDEIQLTNVFLPNEIDSLKAFYGIVSIGSHVGYVARYFKMIIFCHQSEYSYEKVSSYIMKFK